MHQWIFTIILLGTKRRCLGVLRPVVKIPADVGMYRLCASVTTLLPVTFKVILCNVLNLVTNIWFLVSVSLVVSVAN